MLRIEELDLRPRLRREIGPEYPARLEQAILHCVVENVEPVPRGDEFERQREQLGTIGCMQRPRPIGADAPEDRHEFRQVIRADEAELLEELVIGRQIGEQLDHRLGHLSAGLDQVVDQPDLCQDLQHVGIVGERFEVEGRTDRRSEQQILRDRGIEVEPLGIVGLHEIGDAVLDEPTGQRFARFEQPCGRFGLGFRIEPPAQPEGIDVLVEIEAGQDLGNARRQTLVVGDPGTFIIDPVGMEVEVDVAGPPRLVDAGSNGVWRSPRSYSAGRTGR